MDSERRDPARGGPSPRVTLGGQTGVDDPGSDVFLAAVEAAPVPMVLSDPGRPDNPIVFANPAFARMTGYDRSEIVGRNCRFLQGSETDADTVDRIRHAIQARTDISVELLNYRKDGTAFWNALSVSPVFDPEGGLVYFFASQLDVSRRRDAEEALREARRMEELGRRTGTFAHDFNNLLQVIAGSLDGLKDHAASSGDPGLVRRVGAASEAARRATALTRQILEAAREPTSEGRIVSFNALVLSLGEPMRRIAGAAVRLETGLGEGLWNVRLDPARAEAALLELVTTVRHALAESGTIRVDTTNVDVAAGHDLARGGLPPGRYCMVVVSGSDMSGEPPPCAAEPSSSTPGHEGRGAGLPAVHGLAERSGGAVRIESHVGRGTVARLYIPAAADEKPDRPAADATQGGGERVLVVDDRPEVAELARSMLEDVGYAVEVARDGRDALARLARGFDLLFSDLVMPGGLDGVSLAREAQRRHPGLKVLLTTGDAGSALARTDADGANFVTIAKPYRRADLATKVRSVLDGPAGIS